MDQEQSTSVVDRRSFRPSEPVKGAERRQFAESREALSPDVQELAAAIDAYKQVHRRRHVTLAQVLEVAKSLGYHK